jgi:hypothetical protein
VDEQFLTSPYQIRPASTALDEKSMANKSRFTSWSNLKLRKHPEALKILVSRYLVKPMERLQLLESRAGCFHLVKGSKMIGL